MGELLFEKNVGRGVDLRDKIPQHCAVYAVPFNGAALLYTI